MTITAAAELLVVDPATIYRWRKGKQSTITPEQADRLVMETGPIVDGSADVTSFAFSDEGRKLIEEMRGF
jgi:plasmid maintenance system antidote protein VapI